MESDRAVTQPKSLDEALAEARARQAAGQIEDAKARYEHILTRAPGHPQSLTMLASICYRLGQVRQADAYVEEALEVYRSTLAENPEIQRLRAAYVNLLLARGRNSEAEAAIQKLTMPLVPMRADEATFERLRRQGQERNLPAILVNTLPKTASESIWNKLAQGLGMAQCHVSIGLFPDCCAVPARVQQLATGGISAKEHLPATPHNLATLVAAGISRIVMHVRDPRQATLSWAHFVRNDIGKRPLGPLWRRIVPPADVLDDSVRAQIDWHIANYLPIVVGYIGEWVAAAEDPGNGIEIRFLTFEEFKRDPADYYARVLEFLDIDAAMFAADANAEVVHLRKGETDEWRGTFKPIQRDRAWDKIPPPLAKRFGWPP